MDKIRLSRYVGNHMALVTVFCMLLFVIILTVTAPYSIAQSLRELLPETQTPPAVNMLGPDDIVVKVDQLMKSPVALQQDDDRLIQRIRRDYLLPPSTEPYSLTVGDDPSQGQSQAIMEVVGQKRGGFFVECGALDGETRSNTLVFEKTLNWRGLLIEGDPKNYQMVLGKHRKTWTVGACLSTTPYPSTVMFQQHFNIGKISKKDPSEGNVAGHVEVQCLPIYSILLALNVTTIDYFSLDVEGVELEVLETLPWDKVDIKTLSVEFIHGAKGKDALRQFMVKKGYWVYKEVSKSNGWANDFIFVKRSYKQHEDVVKPLIETKK